MRIGYIDSFSGAAGDMIVGAIIDTGCDTAYLQSQLDLLEIPSVKLVATKVKRSGLAGISVEFQSAESEPPHRSFPLIEGIINRSTLSDRVKEQSVAVFRRIAEAEARVHDMPLEKVHFHEVGAIDSICDIICAVAGFERLGIEKLCASELLLGSGVIESAHGAIPLPSPATQEIARGFPVRRRQTDAEMTTPTGAAIITELAEYSSSYEMNVESVGYGAGSRDLDDRPNLLRLLIGESREEFESDEVIVIETNIDDSTPEQIGYLQQRILDTGALDCFVTQVLMKKNRPGFLLSAIVIPERREEISAVILRESTTAGVRSRREQRRKLCYTFTEVETAFGRVRIKFFSGGDISKFSPEYDDVLRAACESGAPFNDVYHAALRAAYELKEKKK